MFGKRGVDVTAADIRVMHGVCHIRGVVALIPGHDVTDLRTTVQEIANLIKRMPEVRDVSIDVAYRGERPG